MDVHANVLQITYECETISFASFLLFRLQNVNQNVIFQQADFNHIKTT